MFRLSKLADYATLVMTCIARGEHQVYTAVRIAEQLPLAAPTVSKILKTLRRAGLLVSYQGAHGGYRLAHPAREITIAQVVDAIEGSTGVTECISSPGLCRLEGDCLVQTHWQRIDDQIRATLDGYTLADMAAPPDAASRGEGARLI